MHTEGVDTAAPMWSALVSLVMTIWTQDVNIGANLPTITKSCSVTANLAGF
jgi:hypothetical protein